MVPSTREVYPNSENDKLASHAYAEFLYAPERMLRKSKQPHMKIKTKEPECQPKLFVFPRKIDNSAIA